MKYLFLVYCFFVSFLSAQNPAVTVLDYDYISQFEDGFALTQKDKKYGIINAELATIIPPILDEIYCYDYSPYFFNNELHGILDSTYVVYDTLGQLVKQFDQNIPIENNNPNLLLSKERKAGNYIIRTGSNQYQYFGSDDWGCVHINGDTIVPFEFNGIIEASTDSSFIG